MTVFHNATGLKNLHMPHMKKKQQDLLLENIENKCLELLSFGPTVKLYFGVIVEKCKKVCLKHSSFFCCSKN